MHALFGLDFRCLPCGPRLKRGNPDANQRDYSVKDRDPIKRGRKPAAAIARLLDHGTKLGHLLPHCLGVLFKSLAQPFNIASQGDENVRSVLGAIEGEEAFRRNLGPTIELGV